MDRNEFMKKVFEIKPTSIEAKVDKHEQKIVMTGRGVDLLALSLAIVESIVNKLPLSIDNYCNILKEGFNQAHKQDDGVATFKKAFEDLLDEYK